MTQAGEDDKKPEKSGGRGARLAAALRENLRRRKAQERGRNAPTAPVSRTKAAGPPESDKGG